jgi:predicted regulator of Ras-like GTPase activity (Roadblock/LC7/MglB family)
MRPDRWTEILADVTKVAGVRGAVVVSAEDGLVVHEAAMEGLATADVAALATAVTRHAERISATLADGPVRLCTLAATTGMVVAVQGAAGLWLVAVTDLDAELGRLRLLLGDVAPELS